MDVSKEANLGFRVDDTAQPLLVVVLVDLNRKEEVSLAGSRPPGSHQSARNQSLSTLSGSWQILEDFVQDFWGNGRGCICRLDP